MYDYVDGKADWLAAGLPTEGAAGAGVQAGDVARADVPTCGLTEPIADVQARVVAAGWDTCVVVNDERIVLGLLGEREMDGSGGDEVERRMRAGPSTFRPNVPIEEMAAFMTEHALERSPITTSDGRLVGLLWKDDAVRAAHDSHRHDHRGE